MLCISFAIIKKLYRSIKRNIKNIEIYLKLKFN